MYDDFYGFTGLPFALTPDPACFFDGLSHRLVLAALRQSLAQGEGVVVVTGDVGTGKSTLFEHMLTTIDPALITADRLVCSDFDGEGFIPAIARAFGRTAWEHGFADLDAMECFLHEEARSGRRCLLVLDEAQRLSLAALETLCALSTVQLDGQPVLQIMLVGQPKLRNRLEFHPDLEPLRQRVIASHQLGPLEAGEVERYIQHRLRCVGWSGKPDFDPRVFVEIHAATGGVPARINQIASRLLLNAAAGQADHIDGAMLSQVLAELPGRLPRLVAFGLPAVERAPREPLARALMAPDIGEGIMPAERWLKTPLEVALARCEEQIAELKQTVSDLAGAGEGRQTALERQDSAALHERVASLESRVIEQERTIRHTLTMLIDWIERDEQHSVAA